MECETISSVQKEARSTKVYCMKANVHESSQLQQEVPVY